MICILCCWDHFVFSHLNVAICSVSRREKSCPSPLSLLTLRSALTFFSATAPSGSDPVSHSGRGLGSPIPLAGTVQGSCFLGFQSSRSLQLGDAAFSVGLSLLKDAVSYVDCDWLSSRRTYCNRLSLLCLLWPPPELKIHFSVNESECAERGGRLVTWCSREQSVVTAFQLLHISPFWHRVKVFSR